MISIKMDNLYFATLADINYSTRVEVMFDSLEKNCNVKSKLFLLCIDDKIYNRFLVINKNENVELLKLCDLENEYKELKIARDNRSYVEYIFTLSPYLPLYILLKFKYVDRLTTLDADIFFLSDPKDIIYSLQSDQIGITSHSFPDNLKYLERNGIYNVSFQSFPNNQHGINCLEDWKANCFSYCGDMPSEGRYADQKYLDLWPQKFKIKIFEFPYIGLAPWNTNNNNLTIVGHKFEYQNELIILYHFHHFRRINNFVFTLGISDFNVKNISNEILSIYKVYIDNIRQKENFDKNLLRDNFLIKSSIKKYILLLNSQVIFILIFNKFFRIDIRNKFNLIFKLYEFLFKHNF